jgi:hypothetical protein
MSVRRELGSVSCTWRERGRGEGREGGREGGYR